MLQGNRENILKRILENGGQTVFGFKFQEESRSIEGHLR